MLLLMQVIHGSPTRSQLKNTVISTITNARLIVTEPQSVIFTLSIIPVILMLIHISNYGKKL